MIFSTMIGTIEIPRMLSDPAVQERILSGTRRLLLSSFLDTVQDGLESELGSSVPDESLIHCRTFPDRMTGGRAARSQTVQAGKSCRSSLPDELSLNSPKPAFFSKRSRSC